MADIQTLLAHTRVVPIVTPEDPGNAVAVAGALRDAGLPVIEVVLRTPAALDAIRRIARELPEVVIGAGTVLNINDFQASLDAGATFIISPGATRTLLTHAREQSVPYLPAIATASELMLGLEEGYQLFKYFPAAQLGIGTLKALAGPFPHARFCANGGITRENAPEFLAQPNVFAVGVSWVVPATAVAKQDWAQIRALGGVAAAL